MGANDDTAEIGVKIAGVGGKAVIYTNGAAGGNRLVVTLTNLTAAPIPLAGGKVVSPARPGAASMLYLGFGTLLTGAQLNGLRVTADGWDGEAFTGAINNWGIAPKQDMTLAAGGSIEITVANIMSTAAPQSGWLTVSHRNFGELEDDAVQAELKLENPPAPPGRLDLVVSLEPQEIQVTAPGRREIENSLRLRFTNPHPRDLVAEGTPRVGTPTFTITFDYPDPQHPDRGAIATRAEAFNFKLNAGTAYENTWTRVSPTQQADLEWKLLPQDRAILGPHGIVEFTFEKMVSTLPPVATVMYIRYFNIPGYANGSFTLEIRKKAPVPRIELFGASPMTVDWGVMTELELTWRTFGSDFRYIKGNSQALAEHDSMKVMSAQSPPGLAPEYTLVCGKGDRARPEGKPEELPIMLTVNPPSVELHVDRDSVYHTGTVKVTWSVKSAATCEVKRSELGKPDEVIGRTLSGEYRVPLTRDTTFTVKAVGNGEVIKPITVTVHPPTVEIDINPKTVNFNQSAFLNWWAMNAATCEVKKVGGAGTPDEVLFRALSGGQPVTLTRTTTFTVKGAGNGEATKSVTVAVRPLAIVTFRHNGDEGGLNLNRQVTIQWEVSGATSCEITGPNGAIVGRGSSGTYTVTLRQTTKYTLKAVGNGEVTRELTVSVAAPVIKEFHTVDFPVLPGRTSLLPLRWAVVNADYCDLKADDGSFISTKLQDAVNVTPGKTTTYTLKAFGNGQVTQTTTLRYLPVKVVEFSAYFGYDRTRIVWRVEDAARVRIETGAFASRVVYDRTAAAGERVLSGELVESTGFPGDVARICCWAANGECAHDNRGGYSALHPDHLTAFALHAAPVAAGDNPGIGVTAHNGAGKAALYIGNDTLTVTLINTSGAPLLLPGGAPVAEPSIGSLPAALYFTFGAALDHEAFKALKIAAPGWSAVYFESPARNWGLFPDHDTTLAAGASVSFSITNIVVAGQPRPGFLTIDYYNIGGLGNDSPQVPLPVQRAPHGPTDLNINAGFTTGPAVAITPSGSAPLANVLTLAVSNNSATDPLVAADTPSETNPPTFFLYFVYGKTPGYWALCTREQAATIDVTLANIPIDGWKIDSHRQEETPYWTLTPQTHEILGVGQAGLMALRIANIVTAFSQGTTLLYLQWGHIPGHNDGCITVPITKVPAEMEILSFGSTSQNVDWGATLELTWTTRAADFCFIIYDDEKGSHSIPVDVNGSHGFRVAKADQTYTLVCGHGTPMQPTVPEKRQTITVPVNPPVIEKFEASRDRVQLNGTVTIAWKTRSADCRLLFRGQPVATDPAGSYSVALDSEATFTLQVSGNGTETRSLTVKIGKVNIYDFHQDFWWKVGMCDTCTPFTWEVYFASHIVIVQHLRGGRRSTIVDMDGSSSGPSTKGRFFATRALSEDAWYIMECTGLGGPVKDQCGSSPPGNAGNDQEMLSAPLRAMSALRTMPLSAARDGVKPGQTVAAGGIAFSIGNAAANGSNVVYLGQSMPNTLSLVLTNNTGAPLTLAGGAAVAEPSIGGSPAALYLTMGGVLDEAQLGGIEITAPGWSSLFFGDAPTSWGLFPEHDVTLPAGGSITFTIAKVVATGQPRPGFLTIDYYNIGDLENDSPQLPLVVQNAPSGPQDLHLVTSLPLGATVNVTPTGESPIANGLTLVLGNPSSTAPLVPSGTPAGAGTPAFYLSFPYAGKPGYGSLCTAEQAAQIEVSATAPETDGWESQSNLAGTAPYWTLTPQSAEILGVEENGTVSISIENIVTALQPGATLMYLQWGNIPGYNDGFTAFVIEKVIPSPTIVTFAASVATANLGDTVELTWATYGTDFCLIEELGKTFPTNGSTTVPIDAATKTYTLTCGAGTPSAPVKETSTKLLVAANPPSVTELTASAREVAQGTSVTVRWSVESVFTCTLEVGGSSVASGKSGSYTTVVNETTTFELVCNGATTVTSTLTVTVMPVKILAFSAVQNGDGSYTITWDVAYASDVEIGQTLLDGGGAIFYSESTPSVSNSGSVVGWLTAGIDGDRSGSIGIWCMGAGGGASQSVSVAPSGGGLNNNVVD